MQSMQKYHVGPAVLASVMAFGLLDGCAANSGSLTQTSESKTPVLAEKAFTYGSPKAEMFPTGSKEWWETMRREGRAGASSSN
jgi:hypothetical protein